MSKLKTFPPKHPTAKLDYVFDWAPSRNNTGLTNWLEEGETIIDFDIDVEDGLNLDSSELINDDTSVRVWISGGSLGSEYTVSCNIITSSVPSREDTRSCIIPIEER